MGSEIPGHRLSPQNWGPSGQQSRFRYGIHFSNAPADVRRSDLEALFNDFGQCRVRMDPGALHGWVGYDSIEECNNAYDGMNPNALGMYIHKGPYEAGPMLRPPTGCPPMGRSPMGGPPMGRPPMGRPPMGRPPMGRPPIGRPPIGRPPMGGLLPFMAIPPMGGQYSRNYGQIPCVPRRPPVDFYEDDYYDYYANPYEEIGYGYDAYDEMCPERPGCDVGPCTMCGASTSYSCERCGAFYCSEICQRHDWNTHRELCDKNIPSLNYGPRHRPGSGDIQEERMQRLATPGEREVPSSRPSAGSQEGRSPRKSRPNGDDRQDGDRRPEGEFKGQRRADYASCNQRSERRNENGFESRRGDGESKPTGDRRNQNGFGDRHGDGNRKPMTERRNEGSFSDRRGDGDSRRNEGGFGDRRGDGDKRPMGERRNENGFGDRRGGGDRPSGERRSENSFGDRRPMGERRNNDAFGDRRQGSYQNRDSKHGNPEDRPCYGEDKKSKNGPEVSFENAKAESSKGAVPRSENPVMAVAGSDVKINVALGSLLKKSSGGDDSQAEKSELVAEQGVCIDFKMNDTVVITNATALDSIYVTPPIPALSEDFKKVITGIALHCKDAPLLDRAPALNEVVACQFTLDDDFYRAVVKETLPGGEYLMQFCDYGNVQKCKIDKLKAIPDELKKCPWNAVKVSLSGVSNVPIAGPIQRLFVELTDQEVNLKLQFDGDISKGVVLVKPNGKSVNDEVNALIGQAASPDKENVPAPNIDTPTRKVDTPAPKDDPLAPKMDAPSSAKEIVESTSSATVPARSPEQVLTSLLKKAKMPEPETPATYPAEEGVCTQLKNDETVIITASTGTGSTYVTRVPESREMRHMADKLNEHCKSAPPLGREPREKEIVACQFVDKFYYRAVVSEALPNGEYMLTFCDYGNAVKYKAADLKAVPSEYKMLPWQAVQVYFRDVDPVPVTGKVGDILDKLSSEETQLKLRFTNSIENGVELVRPDGKSVNEELSAVIRQAEKPVNLPAEANAAPEDFSPAASVPLPTDKPFTLLVFGILGDFLVAACNAEAPEIEQFEKTFAPRIIEYCQKAQETEHRPEPGQMCLAKFNDDWYRALTMNSEGDETRDVFFVDYGNMSKVKPSDIRKIPQEIKSQLHTLTLCTIVGVRNSPDVWTKIKMRIEKDIEQRSVSLFTNVTAVIRTESTAEITIPEFKEL